METNPGVKRYLVAGRGYRGIKVTGMRVFDHECDALAYIKDNHVTSYKRDDGTTKHYIRPATYYELSPIEAPVRRCATKKKLGLK